MNIEKILLDEFTPYIYNDINQAGEEMLVIDLKDIHSCITNLVKKLTIPDVSNCSLICDTCDCVIEPKDEVTLCIDCYDVLE